jgi:sec-independent protein translocase protein TatB
MLDFGAGELVVIGVVALVAIGPKELPGLLRTIGQMVGKMRRMAGDFQGQFNDAMREADMAEAQKMIADLQKDVSGISIEPNPTPAFPVEPETPEPALPVDVAALSIDAPIKDVEAVPVAADDTPAPKKRTRKAKGDDDGAAVETQPVAEDAADEKPKRRRPVKKSESQEEAS